MGRSNGKTFVILLVTVIALGTMVLVGLFLEGGDKETAKAVAAIGGAMAAFVVVVSVVCLLGEDET